MGDLTFTGGCLCGAIRFSARLSEHDVSVHTCSCLTCQRHSGSLTLCWLELPKAAITWTGPDGEPARYRSSAQSSRAFCRHCGSTLGALDDGDTLACCSAASTTTTTPRLRPPLTPSSTAGQPGGTSRPATPEAPGQGSTHPHTSRRGSHAGLQQGIHQGRAHIS
ncbi:GFA family protein [Metapseudomonas otitidis]